MKFGFYSLGCKVNRLESEALAQIAETRGHTVCSQQADVFIINTCTVTSVSDHKNIRAIHKIRRENPGAVIAVCGCLAQTDPDKLREIGEVDLVCGTADRVGVIALCERYAATRRQEDTAHFRCLTRQFEALPPGVPRGRTRALIKVQDGCDNYCAYCIIPYARGHVRSMPLPQAVEQARAVADQGVREIVLTGIELSAYGRDLLPPCSPLDLIEQVCRAVPMVRVRLSSLEPRTADEQFCTRLSALPNLMPHFHLSLQSGCDRILRLMRRRYTISQFEETVKRLRAAFPDCSLTTDLIVGFPGETEADFQQTLRFLTQCSFSDVHVFPYSKRQGTAAAAIPGHLPMKEKERRADLARQTAACTRKAYLDRFTGKTLRVLFEHQDKNGLWCGHAPYHFVIKTDYEHCRKNEFLDVLIGHNDGVSVFGSVATLQNGYKTVY